MSVTWHVWRSAPKCQLKKSDYSSLVIQTAIGALMSMESRLLYIWHCYLLQSLDVHPLPSAAGDRIPRLFEFRGAHRSPNVGVTPLHQFRAITSQPHSLLLIATTLVVSSLGVLFSKSKFFLNINYSTLEIMISVYWNTSNRFNWIEIVFLPPNAAYWSIY